MATVTTVDSIVQQAFIQLIASADNRSLLRKYLTPQVFQLLRHRETQTGATLWHIIKSGVQNPSSRIGIYAADSESYEEFALLFDPIIQELHHVDLHSCYASVQQEADCTPIPEFSTSACKRIVSTRIRACRSFPDIPFHPRMSELDYQEVESRFVNAARDLPPQAAATYYSMATTHPSIIKTLRQRGLCFSPVSEDRYLSSANAGSFHPLGRGVLVNQTKDFIVWVNEEDHLRFMSVQPGAHLNSVFQVLRAALQFFDKKLTFAHDKRLGYLTFCPSNIGTTIRASVHIKLSKLGRNIQRLKKLADKHSVQVRGVGGENSALDGTTFDISNTQRLGISVFEAVRQMQTGVEALVRYELRDESVR